MYTIRLLQEGDAQGGGVWFVLAVLAVFFVMVLLGWLASSKGWLKKEAELQPETHAAHGGHEVHETHETHEAHAPVSAAADDLTTLEGIGPKVAKVLAGIGITSFASLAKADLGALRTALDAAGYKYMEPAGWVEQAALAAKGDFENLKKLQNSLKGGRKVA